MNIFNFIMFILQDALAVRKAIEAKRDEAFMPKAQRIQKWVNEELDVLLSTVDAEKTLEQLEVDRETIYKMMQRCEVIIIILYKNNNIL